MMKLNNLIFLALTVISLVSCSGYNRVVKGDDYQRKFELANELYDHKHYLRSVELYEQIYQRFPKTNEGELAFFRMGKAYYEEKDYYMAGYYLGMFPQRFPLSTDAQEAMFLSAMCSVANSPSIELDQNDTELAINNLQQFINTYPESPLVDSCTHVMDRLRLKIETKDFNTVKLYAKIESYRAAVTSSMIFLKNYPRSTYKEEVSYLLVKNSYLLAINSIESKKNERIEETKQRYSTFVTEFPVSEYRKELEKYYDLVNR